MENSLLAEADRIVSALSPGRRESVREIVIDAMHRGHLPTGSRAFLDSATGSALVGDVLAAALSEAGDGEPKPVDGDSGLSALIIGASGPQPK